MMRSDLMCMLALVVCGSFWGCAVSTNSSVDGPSPMSSGAQRREHPAMKGKIETIPYSQEITDWGWEERAISEEELNNLEKKDPSLTSSVCRKILARLNTKAEFHISEDIRNRKPLKVPNDFRAFRNWNPLPRRLANLSHIPRSIVVVKDIPFLCWYEKGKAAGGTHVGLGRPGEETVAGTYTILEKDADKHSRSYTNDFGEPAWMPWAMRIYDGVWIHAGYLTGPYCSHGCLILPMEAAEELFRWGDTETVVVITESMSDLHRHLNNELKTRSP